MKKVTLLIVFAALLAACEEKTDTQAGRGYIDDEEKVRDTMAEPVMPSDTLYYDIQGFNKTNPDCQSDTANCAIFIASFPVIEMRLHHRVADSINNLIRGKLYRPLIGDKPANGIKDLLEPYFAAYKEELTNAQNEGNDVILPWSFNRRFSVLENSKRIFSIEHHERGYAGGAHPNSFTNHYHFNPQTGKQMRVADILKPGGETVLYKLAEKKFKKQMKLPAGQSYEEAGYWFKDNRFYLPENFKLKNNGVVFLYNPYEIASFAQGPIELFFTYKELESVLGDDFNPLKPAA